VIGEFMTAYHPTMIHDVMIFEDDPKGYCRTRSALVLRHYRARRELPFVRFSGDWRLSLILHARRHATFRTVLQQPL
jgi:hypothetical protein